MKKIFQQLVFWFCFTAVSVYAQMGGVRGVVTDQDFEVPLPGVKVLVSETGQETVTGDTGSYYLEQLEPGAYTLLFSKGGYTRITKSGVVVSPGQLAEVDTALAGEYEEMDELVVRDIQLGGASEIGLLNLRLQSAAMMDSVGADLMSQAGASDAASALKLVSGATVQDGKYAVVRGLPDRYVVSLMNGVRLPTADANKRAVQLDQFPSALIESIQVSKTFTPDQQGDASGGAVNIILKSVPDEPVLAFKIGVGFNTQVTGNDDYISYKGGGVNYWGMDDGGRDLPFGVEDAYEDIEAYDSGFDPDNPGPVYEDRERHADAFVPVMGTSSGEAPLNHGWSLTAGNKYEMGDLTVGALGSFFYKNEFDFYDGGINDKRIGIPKNDTYGYHGTDTGDRYELYDVTRAEESVLWGGLFSLGAKTERNDLNLTYMQTHSANDVAMVMDDTRGAELMSDDEYVYYRNETLQYTERDTSTLQLRGHHVVPFPDMELGNFFSVLEPEFDWNWAKSDARMWQPDMRGIIGKWEPDDPDDPTGPGTWGNINRPDRRVSRRFWRDINETSDQVQGSIKLPFEQWTDTKGFFKAGVFVDDVERTYEQDSFAYRYGPGPTPWANLSGSYYEDSFSDLFEIDEAVGYHQDYYTFYPNEMPWQIVKSNEDADYDGTQKIDAWYWMADVPLTSWLKTTGGIRTERTQMNTEFRASDGETLYFYQWNDEVLEGGRYGPDEWHLADTEIDQTDVLPSISAEYEPVSGLKFRGAYSKTVARPTFKEIAPIQQVEYLGSDQFIGNNNLTMSELENYDLRFEYLPASGTFISASWFYKEIKDPIEYVTVPITQDPYVQPFNFPEGWLQGYEIEGRQNLGDLIAFLEGFELRMNATLIESEVTVPEKLPDTNKALAGQNVPEGAPGQVISDTRDMKGAPEYLFNASISYDIKKFGTRLNLFYVHKGDTLIAGEGTTDGYIPNVYAEDYGELNFSISQDIGKHLKLSFAAKNLLDPEIQTVYRSEHISHDMIKTSYKKGVEYSISLSGNF